MLAFEMFPNDLLWLVFFLFIVLGVKDLAWLLLLATCILGLSVLFLFCLEATM